MGIASRAMAEERFDVRQVNRRMLQAMAIDQPRLEVRQAALSSSAIT
jgi:hypothetical protein